MGLFVAEHSVQEGITDDIRKLLPHYGPFRIVPGVEPVTHAEQAKGQDGQMLLGNITFEKGAQCV